MKNVQDLRDSQNQRQSPGQHIGDFLLQHSNSPEYLVSQLEAYLMAAKMDLSAERNARESLLKGMSHA
jgi:hypothetical protein